MEVRIWIYSSTPEEAQRLSQSITAPDTVAGTSVRAGKGAAFPQGGLTPAMYAAICGEVDLLLSSEPIQNTIYELFVSCNVSVRSASSLSSKSS